LSSALPLISIYVCTKFNFNTRQAPTLKKCLWGDNSVNTQDRTIMLVHCVFPHYYLSINQVSLKSLVLSKIWPGQASIMKNGYGEITQ